MKNLDPRLEAEIVNILQRIQEEDGSLDNMPSAFERRSLLAEIYALRDCMEVMYLRGRMMANICMFCGCEQCGLNCDIRFITQGWDSDYAAETAEG